MPGEHGSLSEYFAAYDEFGGTPPIPDWAGKARGEKRSLRTWLALLPLTVIGGIAPGIAVMTALPAEAPLLVWVSVTFMMVAAMYLVSHLIAQPIHDWWEDIPRHGLSAVDDGGTT